MAIPDYETLMLPLLRFLGDEREHSFREIVNLLSDFFSLSEDEKNQPVPSGGQALIDNRIGWSRLYLKKSGLIEDPRRGYMKITSLGQKVLSKKPQTIDVEYLGQFPKFVEFRTGNASISQESTIQAEPAIQKEIEKLTPDELMDSGFASIKENLKQELIIKLGETSPAFFEKIVLKLLTNLGYGDGKVTGRSGDGGIDGETSQDKLGLEKVFFQAKRYQQGTPISASQLRDFIGALDTSRAHKGVFITTSKFPRNAEELVSRTSKKIILIEGEKLAELMIDANVGVYSDKKYEIKKADSDFFFEE